MFVCLAGAPAGTLLSQPLALASRPGAHAYAEHRRGCATAHSGPDPMPKRSQAHAADTSHATRRRLVGQAGTLGRGRRMPVPRLRGRRLATTAVDVVQRRSFSGEPATLSAPPPHLPPPAIACHGPHRPTSGLAGPRRRVRDGRLHAPSRSSRTSNNCNRRIAQNSRKVITRL